MFKIIALVLMLHGNQPVIGVVQVGEYETKADCEGERQSPQGNAMIFAYVKSLASPGRPLDYKILRTECGSEDRPA